MTQKALRERLRHDLEHLQMMYSRAVNEIVEKQGYIARLEGRIKELELKLVPDRNDDFVGEL